MANKFERFQTNLKGINCTAQNQNKCSKQNKKSILVPYCTFLFPFYLSNEMRTLKKFLRAIFLSLLLCLVS